MNGWTAKRREQQAAMIRRCKPWTHSTGPRTAEGKARSARNAFKGSNRQWLRAAAVILAMYRRNPGATTLGECQTITPREWAAIDAILRWHQDGGRAG